MELLCILGCDIIILKNQKLKLVYFSPTDSTKWILHKIAEEIDLPIDEEFNLTNHEYKDFKHSFEENDFILLGFPVYGGRVPKTALNRFKGLKANKSKIAAIQTYGNIHYNISLLQIHELIKNNGFSVIGLGSFVCPHSIGHIAIDRPNEEDYNLIKLFGKRLVEKLNGNEESNIEMKNTKSFGKDRSSRPITPKGRNNCLKCGLCVKLCPENAIYEDTPWKTNRKKCIPCFRCVKYCPNNSRYFRKIEYFIVRIFLEIARRIFFKKENKSEIIV